jgi:hypothetical protein
MREDIKEAAKRLRQELKEKFPETKFSVRIERYSMGEAINVFWTNGTASDKVEEILPKYEDIDRDEATGEILCGGNRYVHGHRTVTDDIREKIAKEIKEYYACKLESWQMQHEVWKRIKERDFDDAIAIAKAEATGQGQK